METITSAQNPKIKQLLALQEKSKLRRECGLFVVEGKREIQRCIDSGFEVDTIFFCPEIYYSETIQQKSAGSSPLPKTVSTLGHVRGRGPKDTSSCEAGTQETLGGMERSGSFCNGAATGTFRVIQVSEEVYRKVAYREGTEGIIAEVKIKDRKLDDLRTGESPLIVVLESVEKPGNLGAVLRSADAAGVDAVIVCDPLTDLYNPNLIRASLGAAFSVPCVSCSSEEAISWLKERGIQILTAQLQDSEWYYDTDMKRGTAIVIGTESTGLTDTWREAADAHIKIPMLGMVDSLNASVSAAILMYEAVRQRNG